MNRPGLESLLIDGLISYGGEEFCLRRVPFSIMAIEGYGDLQMHCVKHDICIQSDIGALKQVWYNLVAPSKTYERYYLPFLWIANFCKYFVDYLSEVENVSLENFRDRFYIWARKVYGSSKEFNDWFKKYSRPDFRHVVAANIGYLWKETSSVCRSALAYPLWKETDPMRLDTIETYPSKQSKTLVTPYVYSLFRKLYFADDLALCDEQLLVSRLGQKYPDNPTGSYLAILLNQKPITTNGHLPNASHRSGLLCCSTRWFKPGYTVVTRLGAEGGDRNRGKSRFAYIMATSEYEDHQLLHVLWLYQSHNTILSSMDYPFAKELFLSDKCNCAAKHGEKLRSIDVYGTINIAWLFKEWHNVNENCYFVRQTYRSTSNSFYSVVKSDLRCRCRGKEATPFESVSTKYNVGDVVLCQSSLMHGSRLRPFLILDLLPDKRMILVQSLGTYQVEHYDGTWSNNILQLGATTRYLRPRAIKRKCNIMLSRVDEYPGRRLPFPYNLGGTGDYFVFKDDDKYRKSNVKLNLDLSALCRAVSDSTIQKKKLRGLGLFCGGGGFDRSLEVAGGIEIIAAVDISKPAIHTYRANLINPNRTNLFLGSVDDFLHEVLKGESDAVPAPGEIDIIIAGSPCQGFSVAQSNRFSDTSMKNASLVASVAAFIEVYRPKYALLENVISIARNIGDENEQNVLSQLLCALVGLGYQTQVFNMDAWAFGCAQKRSRLFVVATSQGLMPPNQPNPTHGYPLCTPHLNVGRASNGEQFGTRVIEPAVFDSVIAEDMVKDLPNIGNSHVQICIPFPDHRLVREESELLRSAIAMIPTCPSMVGIAQAIKMGVMGERQVAHWSTQSNHKQLIRSKSYKRIDANGLFPTIMASLSPHDAFCGQFVHWDQHRVISIMEARRAQGIPDDDVLIGSPVEQWRLIGNTVPGPVGIALGLAIAEAWFTDQN